MFACVLPAVITETPNTDATKALPEKARRQADLAVAELASAQQLLATAEAKLLEVEAAARGAEETERQKQVGREG